MKGAQEYAPSEGRTPTLVRMVDVEPQEVEWLWYPYIPIGKLTILEGDPGLGKTFIALTITAIITKGDPFLDQSGKPSVKLPAGNVVYLSAEDGLADTLRPRLDAAGADVNRIFALTGWRETVEGQEAEGLVSLADTDLLRKTLKKTKPILLIVDPLQAFLGADVDMHRANEVRPLLHGLSNLAEEYGCAVIAIRHLAKGRKGRAIYSGLGSIDFAAAARSILLAGEYQGERMIAHVKNNLVPEGKSIRYKIDGGGLYWLGMSDVKAEDMTPSSSELGSGREEAIEFLEAFLEDGPVLAAEVQEAAKAAGITLRTLRRAKEKLGVISRRQSAGNDGAGGWLWMLCKVATLEESGHLATLQNNVVPDGSLQDDQGGALRGGLAILRPQGGQGGILPAALGEGKNSQGGQGGQLLGGGSIPPEFKDLWEAVKTGELTGPLDMGYLKHPDVRTYVQGAFKRLGRYGPEDILGRAAKQNLTAVAKHYGIQKEGTP